MISDILAFTGTAILQHGPYKNQLSTIAFMR